MLDRALLGIPSQQAYLQSYAERMGLTELPHARFYLAYAQFRFAAMVRSVGARHGLSDGDNSSEADNKQCVKIIDEHLLPGLLSVFGKQYPEVQVRATVLDILKQDFIRTAYAKGLRQGTILHHVLRNAFIPILTVIGLHVFGHNQAARALYDLFVPPPAVAPPPEIVPPPTTRSPS